MSDIGFCGRSNNVFESKYFLVPDKILDEKTYRLRCIMRAAASLVTCPAYLARVLAPAALFAASANYVVGCASGSFPAFALLLALATPVFLLNKWRADDIAKQQKKFFIQKPAFVYSDDAFIDSVRGVAQEHDLLFNGLRSCFASSRENIWFASLVIQTAHASPVVKSWRAFQVGGKLGLQHNALRSFWIPSSPGEEIVFRIDNAGYRRPIQKYDFYGRMAVHESHLRDEGAWTLPTYHSAPPLLSHRHRRRTHLAGMMDSLSGAAASLLLRHALRRLAIHRRTSVSKENRPAR
ncbi:MAG: hypothetical protein ABTQ34_06325 [Bdellovibrionales bacterium]